MSQEEDELEPDPRPNRRPSSHIRRLGAVYLLALLFLGSWLGQFFTQLTEFSRQLDRGNDSSREARSTTAPAEHSP